MEHFGEDNFQGGSALTVDKKCPKYAYMALARKLSIVENYKCMGMLMGGGLVGGAFGYVNGKLR